MKDNHLIDAFMAGIKNKEYNESINCINKGYIYNIKFIIWIISSIILTSYQEKNLKNITFIYTEIQEFILRKVDMDERIYMGEKVNSIDKLIKNKNIMTYFNYIERVKNIIKAVYLFLKLKIEKKYILFWIEYFFICELIVNSSIEKIIISGHYDRYATWISYICKYENIYFEINQHGLLSKINLPRKIFCNKINIFFETEKDYLDGFIDETINYKVEIVGFKSRLTFEDFNKDSKKIIAFASQDLYTDETIDIIKLLYDTVDSNKYIIILYPHYREDIKKIREELSNYNDIYIYTDVKHKNIDYLITYYSTIVYDFFSVNNNINVICIKKDNVEVAYYKYDSVKVISDIDELKGWEMLD